MTTQDLHYVKMCATQYENASVSRLSCKDVRRLLLEREVLLQTLKDSREVLAVALAWDNSAKIRKEINNAIALAEGGQQ